MRIVCVGGGPTGLYFALLMKLLSPEHHITVFERNGAGTAHGWGVTFGGDLLEKLYQEDPVSARRLDQAAFHWRDQVVDIQGRSVQHASGSGYSIRRQRLLDVLADRVRSLGVRLELGHEVTALSELPAADLIVACDGANSRIRHAAGSFQTDV